MHVDLGSETTNDGGFLFGDFFLSFLSRNSNIYLCKTS